MLFPPNKTGKDFKNIFILIYFLLSCWILVLERGKTKGIFLVFCLSVAVP